MRKFILLFFLLPLFSQAQKYRPFPEDSAVWTQQFAFYSFKYTIQGDTLHRGKIYKKLLHSGFKNRLEYVGAYRNDIPERKIYFLAKDSTEEKLLYNFNVKVGDTLRNLPRPLFMPEDTFVVVVKEDSIFIHNEYFRRIHLNGRRNRGFVQIEGVGNDLGVGVIDGFGGDTYFQYQLLGSQTSLKCLEYRNIRTIESDDYCISLTIAALEDETTAKVKMNISPNPSTGLIMFTRDRPFEETVRICNYAGVQILEFAAIGQHQFSLDLSHLPKGFYFVTDGSTISQKLLLQ